MNARMIERLRKNTLKVAGVILLLVFTTTSERLCAKSKEIDDKDITAAIEVEFWGDQAIGSNQINVETKDGIVILSGSQTNIFARERAEKIAESVVGVRSVVNRLQVKPRITRTDKELQKAVKEALLEDPATESYEVKVKVNDAVAELTGTVDSWQERQLCAAVAKSVKGICKVENQIQVEYKSFRSDYEIEQEVKKRLANDVRVDDALIDVDVQDGKVILTGTVGSAQEKRRARGDAWVGNVKEVTTEGLTVQWWTRDKMRRKDFYATRTDEQIENSIKDAFTYDPRVYPFSIEVNVAHGLVVLNGVVDNLKAKKAAEHDADNTVGVGYVRNNIKVRPKVIPMDQELKSRVSDALLENPYVERFDLHISTSNGIVYLSGKVNTSWEKTLAETVAESVKGTVAVVNNINYEHEWVWKPDRQIRQDIQDQLWWSPYVDEDEVVVTVQNGIATLTGTVDTLSERRSAEYNAYEGGAKEVVNNLKFSYPYGSPYDQSIYDTPYYYGL